MRIVSPRAPALALLALLLTPQQINAQPAQAQGPGPGNDKGKDEKKWDVTAPFGPVTPLSFETSEGTWINLDVSPDGRSVVFDLLGDLYLMPISGGPARRLTGGPAFDMQPCFSPDGREIAFISDRDGLSNIWILAIAGGEARQVSREKDRPLSSPAFSPDGSYLLARKHFVKERSQGAGEIWLYHRQGAEGLQVTEKNGWQKDAGEPALSPDGRTLYYSKEITPGQTFEYNKDPNGTIYGIFARDLDNGQERRVTAPQGGAHTPRPSPDGRHLAFVRRVRARTVLSLHDLATGEERALFAGLDRDLQETWATQGVYPRYAFTPDGAALVIWAQGKIWRVDLRSGRAAEIPFTARVEQVIHQALRFPQKVHEDRFPVRMLRHVSLSPDGRHAAYGALGRIYIKQMPGGAPTRLTADRRMELAPSFSRDGRSLVFTTWSDAERGRVRIAALGGAARDVVRAPGHYTEPALSPDGRLVAYRQAAADLGRGLSFAARPGVYLQAADGSGAPRLVGPEWPEGQREEVRSPRFDRTGQRLYFLQRRGDKTVLFSTRLDGSAEVAHLQSEWATEIVPSPDDRFVAFVERFRVYVAPFPRTGRPVDLSPESAALPVARLSKESGASLSWSGDGRRVSFALGPTLYTADVSQALAALARKGQKKDQSDKDQDVSDPVGVPIGFEQRADAPLGTVALIGGRIITMTGDQIIERGTVVVQGNRIAAVGPEDQVQVPPGARRIDVRGKILMPGIIDAHAHLGSEDDGIPAETSWKLLANLAFGVTTSHDPSNDTEMVFTSAEMIRAGTRLGPRLYSTGTILYGAETRFKAVVQSYEDALLHLRRLRAVGAFTVKSYGQQRRDARQMILKAGRELGMMVVPEGASLLYLNESMVLDGHTGIEHALPVARLYKDVVTLFARSETGYTPTLIVGYGGLFGENYWYQRGDVWKHPRVQRFTPREWLDPRARRRMTAPDEEWNHPAIARGARQILAAGGLVQLGAHGQIQGLGAHWELWMLQQGGMTPHEALRCATLNPARYLGLDGELGSLLPGKLADLLVLDRDPLADIRNSESISQVMVNGRLYLADTLEQIAPDRRPAPRLYFEQRQQRQ